MPNKYRDMTTVKADSLLRLGFKEISPTTDDANHATFRSRWSESGLRFTVFRNADGEDWCLSASCDCDNEFKVETPCGPMELLSIMQLLKIPTEPE